MGIIHKTIHRVRSVAALMVILSGAAGSGIAAAISGQITNGTTSKPAVGLTVELISPQAGGMQVLARTKTDALGDYRILTASSINPSAGVYLVQARYEGVGYRAQVQFDGGNSAVVNLQVFNTARHAPPLTVRRARFLVQAQGDQVQVQELFAVVNTSSPPRTYANPSGTFSFHLGPSAGKPQAAVVGLMNMPLPQQIVPGKNQGDYSIACSLRPGLNVILVAYGGDYSSGQFSLDDRFDLPLRHLQLYVLPASLSVESMLFQPSGQDKETSAATYEADNLVADSPITVTLSGAATAATSDEDQVKILSDSAAKYKIPLLASLLLLLLWGLGIRIAKEWPAWKAAREDSPENKAYQSKLDALFGSMAGLDDLRAQGKIDDKRYWKERLELKAKVVALLKKRPKGKTESYVARDPAH